MRNLKLKIEGMHCESCEKIIKMDLEEIQGVGNIQVDAKKGEGRLEVEDSVSTEKILEVIAKSGYKATEIKE